MTITRKSIKLCLLTLVLIISVNAKAQILYEISGKGANAKSYIFATNKFVPLSFLDSVPNLFAKYEATNKVICEFALDSTNLSNMLLKAAMLNNDTSSNKTIQYLSKMYTSFEQELINQTLMEKCGLTLKDVDLMKPAYLTNMIRAELMRQTFNIDENYTSELFFEAIATESGKKIVPLDNMSETLYMLFEREPLDWQKKELMKICQYPEKEIELEQNILNLYKFGRINQIAYEITTPDNTSTLSYSDYQVFAQRNNVWVKRLEGHLQEGKAFIVLDAMYLGGEKGLLQLLRASGYKVKSVNK